MKSNEVQQRRESGCREARYDRAIVRHDERGDSRMAAHAWRMKVRARHRELRQGTKITPRDLAKIAKDPKLLPHQGEKECAKRRAR